MKALCLIDTSIFLTLLNVPHCNQDFEKVCSDFQDYSEAGCEFILPLATILETGNHIAQNGDGNQRRDAAQRFVTIVLESIEDKTPWKAQDFPSLETFKEYLPFFPDVAGRNKASRKELGKAEGMSLADLTIQKQFEQSVHRFPSREHFVWSLDADLRQLHHRP